MKPKLQLVVVVLNAHSEFRQEPINRLLVS